MQQRHAAFKRGSAYLERYCQLIAFAFYLEHVGPETCMYSDWLASRPDLKVWTCSAALVNLLKVYIKICTGVHNKIHFRVLLSGRTQVRVVTWHGWSIRVAQFGWCLLHFQDEPSREIDIA